VPQKVTVINISFLRANLVTLDNYVYTRIFYEGCKKSAQKFQWIR